MKHFYNRSNNGYKALWKVKAISKNKDALIVGNTQTISHVLHCELDIVIQFELARNCHYNKYLPNQMLVIGALSQQILNHNEGCKYEYGFKCKFNIYQSSEI